MRDYQTFNLDTNKVKEQHVVRKDRMQINMGDYQTFNLDTN